MCGRYTLTISDIAALAAAWGAEVDAALVAGWTPRFNVAPGHLAPLLTADGGIRRLVPATFGWVNPRGGLLINARAETAADKRTFKAALAARRVAVPIDGFYEWEGPPSARRPTWFHRDGSPLLLAALTREEAAGPAFVILTTGAVEPVRRLHDRMPVVLQPEQVAAWLAVGPPPALPPPPPGWLAARPASPKVNSNRYDAPDCLAAPAPPAPPPQLRLFPSE